jgi:hypothetical protein
MDKTLEIVVAAAIVIAIGAIAAYLVNDEASSFSEFIGGETDSARCDLLQNRFQNAESDQEQQDIRSKINELDECSAPTGDSPNNGGGGGGGGQ